MAIITIHVDVIPHVAVIVGLWQYETAGSGLMSIKRERVLQAPDT